MINTNDKRTITDYNGICSLTNPYENGTIVYYDVLSGTTCNNYHIDNSKTGYNGTIDTKTTDNQNSCLKFYTFNTKEDDTKVNLLLDHNTTAMLYWTQKNDSSDRNIDGPKEVIEQLKIDTDEWVGTITPENYIVSQTTGGNYTIDYSTYKARLITANEIAEITGNTSFDESATSTGFYFDTNSVPSDTCKSGNTSGCSYGWLYDRTSDDCTDYGCLNNSEVYIRGYWTSTSHFGSSDTAWCVFNDGRLSQILVCDFYYGSEPTTLSNGVRPVIEVLKSNIEKKEKDKIAPIVTVIANGENIIVKAYDSNLSDENNYQYYLSTSSIELVGGAWISYINNQTFKVDRTKDLYVWIYPLKDNIGNVSDNKDLNIPYMAKALKPLVVYYDVLNGTTCTNYHEDNSKTGYNGTSSTKTTDNQNSCLKFYRFNYKEEDSTVSLLLDHNTTAIIGWAGGTITPTNYIVNQTNGGNYTIDYSDYKARLITANEVAEITGNTSFNESTANWTDDFYFNTNNLAESKIYKYGWLYDRTWYNCEDYGCSNNSDVYTYGYWTSTAAVGYKYVAWRVNRRGHLEYEVNHESYGIRPVIEVYKSNL